MSDIKYSLDQYQFINTPVNSKIWLSGKAGTGKTTAAAERIRNIIDKSKRYPNILVFAPTRSYQDPYLSIVSDDGICPDVTTYNAFIQKSLNLFWPVAANNAGITNSTAPLFIGVEEEQIMLAKLIADKIDAGYFAALAMPVSRIFNQVLVAMHKCAAAMIPFENYAEIMKSSWTGDKAMLTIFDQVQECGLMFRDFCLSNNILNYSLKIEVFTQYLLNDPVYRSWIKKQKFHFVCDNVEEEFPASHCLIETLRDDFASMTLIFDQDGGHRSFMGCDPASAVKLSEYCDNAFFFDRSFTSSDDVRALSTILQYPKTSLNELGGDLCKAFSFESSRQYVKMIRDAANEVADLVQNQHVDPDDIVILAPTNPDVLYTEMERSLQERGIKTFFNRPSRPLISEQSTKAFLTVCALVIHIRGYRVQYLDIAQMLQTFIEDIDPMRGQLYVTRAFRKDNEKTDFDWYDIVPFDKLPLRTRQRLTAESEKRFELLRLWIEDMRKIDNASPAKVLYSFFNDILITDGFISSDENSSAACKMLESVNKFQKVLDFISENDIKNPYLPGWDDYFKTVSLGTIRAAYYEDVYKQPENTVLISLASSYLSMNRHDKYQIWLNAASPKWRSSFSSDLSNDLVLSRNWVPGSLWNSLSSEAYNDAHMIRMICALLNRCGSHVYAFSSEMDERGANQKGKLMTVFANLKRKCSFVSDN